MKLLKQVTPKCHPGARRDPVRNSWTPAFAGVTRGLFALFVYTTALILPSAAAPIMSNIELTSLSDTTMAITWSTTNESSSTEVLYGVGGLTSVATVSGTTKYHYIELTNLLPNTTYQYKIRS